MMIKQTFGINWPQKCIIKVAVLPSVQEVLTHLHKRGQDFLEIYSTREVQCFYQQISQISQIYTNLLRL